MQPKKLRSDGPSVHVPVSRLLKGADVRPPAPRKWTRWVLPVLELVAGILSRKR